MFRSFSQTPELWQSSVQFRHYWRVLSVVLGFDPAKVTIVPGSHPPAELCIPPPCPKAQHPLGPGRESSSSLSPLLHSWLPSQVSRGNQELVNVTTSFPVLL